MTEFEFEQERSRGTNRSAPATTCATCGGDRFVVYSLRRPQQSTWMAERSIEPHYDRLTEEVAPCYTCNRSDDRRFPDPALVESMHRGARVGA